MEYNNNKLFDDGDFADLMNIVIFPEKQEFSPTQDYTEWGKIFFGSP